MLDLDQAFEEMVKRDVREEASAEESALLRSDENLGRWQSALDSLFQETIVLITERDAHLNTTRARASSRQEFYEELADFKAFKASLLDFRRHVVRRQAECAELRKAAKQRRHEDHQQGRQASRQRRDAVKQDTHLKHIQDQNTEYRRLLQETKRLLQVEEYFHPEYLPTIRLLAERVEAALYPPKQPKGEE